tara:strand:- start:646 stop:930 length:285 start_codon:yes stop_codon:yes gene_type:complete
MKKQTPGLPSKLKAKLKRVNKHLNKFGGKDLTEEQAMFFNWYHPCQSGFEAGSVAFDISGADYKKYSRASTRYYHWIGDALLEISYEITGIERG